MSNSVARSTGDSIAQEVSKMAPQSTDLSQLVPELLNDHQHRPGVWQQDLKEVNQALHQQGMLPGCDIVGVNGQDLVGKTADGQTVLINSGDTTQTKDLETPNTTPADAKSIDPAKGGMTDQNADGSGHYQVGSDTDKWNVSANVLKQQGIDNPTANQIANYDKELARNNPHLVVNGQLKLKNGDVLNVPPTVTGGDQTAFNADSSPMQPQDQQYGIPTYPYSPMVGSPDSPEVDPNYSPMVGSPDSPEVDPNYSPRMGSKYAPDAGADLAASAGDLAAAGLSVPVGFAKGVASWVCGGADEMGQGLDDIAGGDVAGGVVETVAGAAEAVLSPIGGAIGAVEGVGENLYNAAADFGGAIQNIWNSINV